MDKTLKYIIGFALILWLCGAVYFQNINPLEWRLQAVTPTAPAGAVAGMFDMRVTGYNSLNIASSLTEGTNFNCYWFGHRGGWLLLGKGAATIEVTEADQGYVYAVVEEVAGQSLYVDWAETQTKNPRVAGVSYEDPDADGYKEFVFKFSMANVPKPASGNPTVSFYPYFLTYEKPTINNPSDMTGLGGTKQTKYAEWYVYFSQTKKAFAVTKIEITVNTTDTTKVILTSVAVPGKGSITSDMFGSPLRGTNSLTWTYTIGSSLYDAHYIKYKENDLNKFYFTTQFDVQLASADVLSLGIVIYGLTDSGTLTTITDSLILKYAS